MINNFTTGIQEIINPNLYAPNDIKFERGLPGYETIHQFKLNSLQDRGLSPLKLLSAASPFAHDTPLAFIVVDEENSGLSSTQFIVREPISSALKIDPFFEVYYMITLEKDHKMLNLKANIRAPLIIDPVTHKGWQYIFNETHEEVSCLLPELSIMIHQNRFRQATVKA